jgi:hypothetical protein
MLVCATYETQGLPLPLFVPYQTFQFWPSIVAEAIDVPIGCALSGLWYQTIRKPPLGEEALGSPAELVLN